MKESAIISVTIPNYNHGHYIGGQLEAVLGQSVRPLEVIVVDDGSTDNSVEVIESYVRRDSLVRLIKLPQNLGAVAASNVARRAARGKYVFSTSADDQMLPGMIEAATAMFNEYPDAGLCCSDHCELQTQTGEVKSYSKGWGTSPRFFSPQEFAAVINGGFISGHTSAVNQARYAECEPGHDDFKWHYDWFAFLVLAFRHGVCYIPGSYSMLRVHPDTITQGRSNKQAQAQVIRNIVAALKSPKYVDVLPYFIQGNIMEHFRGEIVEAFMQRPDLVDAQTLFLIHRQLWFFSLQKVQESLRG